MKHVFLLLTVQSFYKPKFCFAVVRIWPDLWYPLLLRSLSVRCSYRKQTDAKFKNCHEQSYFLIEDDQRRAFVEWLWRVSNSTEI